MANLRIIADNVMDRAALSASSTAGVLVVANLQTDKKSDVWRATGTTATISGTVAASESMSGLAILGNFSPTATIRVRLYSDVAGTTQVLDTGAQLACPAPAVVLRGWSAAQAASAYAYGGGAYARIWFAQTSFRKIVVDLVDTANLQSYVEAARIFAGVYWSPTRNASAASATDIDGTTHYRTGAGDLMSRASTTLKRIPIDLRQMPLSDRAALADILRGSRAYSIFLSLFPGHTDLALERDHTIIGKRMTDSEVVAQTALRFGTKIDVESI